MRHVRELLSLIGDLVTLPRTVIGTQSDTLLQGFGSDQGVSGFADSEVFSSDSY
jgi:hypothetical protein